MWKNLLAAIALFYLAALLQSSFFPHLALFGQTPDLVFIFLYGFIFFRAKHLFEAAVLAGYAGFFMDVFFGSRLGPAIIVCLFVAVFIKKIQASLSGKRDAHSFSYFLSLFIVSFLIFTALVNAIYFLLDRKVMLISAGGIVFSLVYDLMFATVFFSAYKNFIGAKNKEQLDEF